MSPETIAETRAFLGDLTMFKDVLPEELDEFAGSGMNIKMPDGQRAFHEGDPSESAFFVRKGLIAIVKHSPSGRMTTLEVVLPGETFGTLAALHGQPYPAEAVSVGRSTILRLPAAKFLDLSRRHPFINASLLSEVGARLVSAQEMRALAAEPVERRIVHVLLWMRQKFGDTLPLTREAVARLASTTTETVIRTLSRLATGGLIQSARARIMIPDPARLQARLDAGQITD